MLCKIVPSLKLNENIIYEGGQNTRSIILVLHSHMGESRDIKMAVVMKKSQHILRFSLLQDVLKL